MAEPTTQPQIYFTSLELHNVRCFGEPQTLEFTDDEGTLARWTLLLGENGVGKTTLLQCLGWMRPVPAFESPQVKDPDTKEKDPDTIEPALDYQENPVLDSLLRVGASVQLELKATLSIGQGLGIRQKNTPKKIMTNVRLVGKDGKLQKRVSTKNHFPAGLDMTLLNIPMFAYNAARSMGSSNLDNADLSDPLASLFSDTTELYDAEEILLDLDYLAAKNPEPRNEERLLLIKRILAAILPDIQAEEHIEILGPKVLGFPDEPSGVRFTTPYGAVPLSGLSLGYQTTLAWTVDLASRLYERYPDSPNPLSEPAVVLIDEIDLHLHPSWQRRIMDQLTRYFPMTQFIATAHSPLVVQAAQDANLVVLNQIDGQVVIQNRPQFVKSWRVDQILTSDLFDIPARSKEIESWIADRNRLLARRGSLDVSEEKYLKELHEKLENLPAADIQEDQAYMDLIRRIAVKLSQEFPDS